MSPVHPKLERVRSADSFADVLGRYAGASVRLHATAGPIEGIIVEAQDGHVFLDVGDGMPWPLDVNLEDVDVATIIPNQEKTA